MKDKVTNSNDIFPMRVCFTMQDRCLSFSSCGAVVSVIARGTNGRLRQPKERRRTTAATTTTYLFLFIHHHLALSLLCMQLQAKIVWALQEHFAMAAARGAGERCEK
jgi:hypothetical protein